MRYEYKIIRGTESTEEKLNKKRNKIKFLSEIQPTTLAEVIYLMCFQHKSTYTFTSKNERTSEGPQCVGSRSRSADDIYLVAKNYVKGITLEQVKQALSTLVSNSILYNWYCGTVRRYVHRPMKLTTKLATVKRHVKY